MGLALSSASWASPRAPRSAPRGGGARPVGLDGQPRLAPGVLRGHPPRPLAVGDQGRRRGRAAVVGFALRQPEAPHFLGRSGGSAAPGKCVTSRSRSSAPRGRRSCGTSGIPPRRSPSRAAGPAAAASRCAGGPPGRCRHSARKSPGLPRGGRVQAAPQLPVGGPGLQRVAAHLRQQLRQPGLVALPERLLHFQDQIVARGLRLRLPRPGPGRSVSEFFATSLGDYGQVRTKKGPARAARAAAAEHAGPHAPLRDAAAGDAHLAGRTAPTP